MARKKKKLSVTKKISIIGLVLIAIQGVYLLIFGSRAEPVSMRDAISKAVEQKSDMSVARREQAKLQLALADYQLKNSKLPASLDELVPTYFDVLPVDPATNKPFKYRVEGTRFFIGDDTPTAQLASAVTGLAGGGPATAEEQQILIDSLNDPNAQNAFVYDPSGKRDPFMAFDFAPKSEDELKTPLERYDLGQLKLTAVLEGFDQPKAIIENAAGKGFTATIGTKIGRNNGEIAEIQKDRVLILETEIDFTGVKKTKTTELRLRTKDQNESSGKGGTTTRKRQP